VSEDKKSFVLYTDYLEHFMQMSLEERGAFRDYFLNATDFTN